MRITKFKQIFTKMALVAALSVGTGVLLTQTVQAEDSTAIAATYSSNATVVNTYNELAAALKNVNVTEIVVNSNIKFTKAITCIPARNVHIYGSKEKGVTIDLSKYWIKGNTSKSGNATMTLENAKVTGHRNSAAFLKGENGWDFVSKNNDVNSETFVQLSSGTLTFEGTNNFDVEDEIAWVNHVVFKTGSNLNGTAANSGNDRSAFRFKGTCGSGYDGTATLEPSAIVNLNVKNKAKSAFYGKVNKIDVGAGADLTIETAGTGIGFEKNCGYRVNPEFNIGEAANVTIRSNSTGSCGARPAIKLAQPGSQFNIAKGATVEVLGKASIGVIESAKNTQVNIDTAKKVTFENLTASTPVFAKNTMATNFNLISKGRTNVQVWDKNVEKVLLNTWRVTGSAFTVNKGTTASVNSQDANFVSGLKVQNYGKIVFSTTNR